MKTILNKIKDVLIRYNPIVFTRLLKLLIDDVKLLKAKLDSIIELDLISDIDNLKDDIKELKEPYYISHKEDIKRLFEKINTLNDKINKFKLHHKDNEYDKETLKEGIDEDTINILIDLKNSQKDDALDLLVNDIYNASNYGSYTNKNDLKEIVLKHINLTNNKEV